ncbi:hypothetical protein AVEN_152769-1, partial [Araneus ventricosus]
KVDHAIPLPRAFAVLSSFFCHSSGTRSLGSDPSRKTWINSNRRGRSAKGQIHKSGYSDPWESADSISFSRFVPSPNLARSIRSDSANRRISSLDRRSDS